MTEAQQPTLPTLPTPCPLTPARLVQLRSLAEFAKPPGHRAAIAADPDCGDVILPAAWLLALLERAA
jgi:hypothetical protein